MAYRRPLTPTQMVVITILWLALVIWIISSGLRLDGLTILMLVCSGVTVMDNVSGRGIEVTPAPSERRTALGRALLQLHDS